MFSAMGGSCAILRHYPKNVMAAQGLLVPGITDLAPGFGCRELLKVSVLYTMIVQCRDSSIVSTSTPGVGAACDKINTMAVISASNVSGHRSVKSSSGGNGQRSQAPLPS